MDPRTTALLKQIENFHIGPQQAQLSFSKRLARENGWSITYAERVIKEYKRFLFLAVASGHPVTPSDEIDQCWHLHLLYTESYWDDLCKNILGRALHHGPTKGGKAEGNKYRDWYEKTLQSYREYFGTEPPADIWPNSHKRFATAHKFRRLNLGQYFLIPRSVASRSLAAMLLCAILLIIGCEEVETFRTFVFDSSANDFLGSYLTYSVIGLLLVYLSRSAKGNLWLQLILHIPLWGTIITGLVRIYLGIQREMQILYTALLVVLNVVLGNILTPFRARGRRNDSGCSAASCGTSCGSSGCGSKGCGSDSSGSGCGSSGCGGCGGGD